MSSHDRRAAARRRAWGRGPRILRFEPLEGRELMAAGQGVPDLLATSFSTSNNVDWGDTFTAQGTIANIGRAAAMAPFTVDVYASPGPVISRASVLLGSVQLPAGLDSGQSINFSQDFNLPFSPLPGAAQAGGVYIDLRVDPGNTVGEANLLDNERQGLGTDIAYINIAAHQQANLIGTALSATPNTLMWGDPINLTQQITNNGPGTAPETRARVVLTPAGITPGGPADVTIASFPVPALAGYGTANVVQTITLPGRPPATLQGTDQYVLTIVQDADFQTNPAVSSQVAQGLGLDQAQLSIAPNPAAPPAPTAKPDLAVASVLAPSGAAWGQTVQVQATVENIGPVDAAGPVMLRFYLTGVNSGLGDGLVLADTTLPDGLKAGAQQTVTETIQIPGRLPAGYDVLGAGAGRILVQVDPENTVDEALKTNNIASSAPVALRLLGTNGTTSVPTTPAAPIPTPINTSQVVAQPGRPSPAGSLAPGQSVAVPAAPTTAKHRAKPGLKKKATGLKLFNQKMTTYIDRLGHDLTKL